MLQLVPTEKFYKVGCGFASFFFSPPEQDQVEEKQRYLANVRVFCSLTKNDWHRVYLVRKIASQYGMEFAQKLVTEAQFNWVFPVEILQQVKEVSPWRWLWSPLSHQFVLLWGVSTVAWLLGDSPQWGWL